MNDIQVAYNSKAKKKFFTNAVVICEFQIFQGNLKFYF
jgi:hypothetical protein